MFHAYHTSTVSGVSTGLNNESNVIYKPNWSEILIMGSQSHHGRFGLYLLLANIYLALLVIGQTTSGYERTILHFSKITNSTQNW